MANTNDTSTKRNRWLSVAWVLGIALVIIICLALQQTALLYVLSTVSVTVLLLIVAMADLGGGQENSAER